VIHHVVMWRLQDEAKRTRLAALTEQIQALAAAMRSTVPGLLRLDLGDNRAAVPDAADLLLYSEFESWHALQGYEAHPLHVQLRGLIAPLRSERRVVDYET
jgi:Stress responsive A/B Barrel Domain